MKLTIYWTDGYESVYELSSNDELKFEELYINIRRSSGEDIFVPMCNVRYFFTNSHCSTKAIPRT